MFHLLSHCWSWLRVAREPLRRVTILVVGLDGAGKTTLLTELQRALGGEALPAAQPGRAQLRVERFEVTLLELPGAPRARVAWRGHYGAAHGLLFVLDASARERLHEAGKALARLLSHPKVSGKPLLLLANKQDEADALLPCELIECLRLERLANAARSPCCVEACAAAGGLQRGACRSALQGLRWLLRAIDNDYEALSARVQPPGPGAARPPPPRRPQRAPTRRHDAEPGRPLQEEGATRRKRKGKLRKKGSEPGRGSAEEPEGSGAAGEGRAGAGAGLLPTNRVGQEEAAPMGTAAPQAVQGTRKKKKKKMKNKIKSQESALEQQHEAVSSTFDLYRRAMLALKMRQEQRKQPAAIAP